MKNVCNGAPRRNGKSFAPHLLHKTLLAAALSAGLFLTGCKKEIADTPAVDPVQNAANRVMSDGDVLSRYSGLSSSTLWELQQARAASARYRNIRNAVKDGYSDISVVVPNMGYHYMRSTLVDATVDIKNPEILVYNKEDDGSFQLVAVEYAVPIELSPDTAPEGFSGSNDVWDRNTGFGLWLLHAWVWSYNPDGVFHSTNPLVHLH